MSDYCECEKKDWGITDFHYARCLQCKKWIPAHEVIRAWHNWAV